jgi:predicted branched-subunit amino acid permease
LCPRGDAGYLLVASVASFVPWLVGSVVGVLVAGLVVSPRAFALDFLLVAFCAAMAAQMFAAVRTDAVVVTVAAVVSVLAERSGLAAWNVGLAGLAGAIVGFVRTGVSDAVHR